MLSEINWSLSYEELFPALFEVTALSRHDRLRDALDIASEADCDEKITASQLSNIKDTVGRAAEKLWEAQIYEAHLLPMYRQEVDGRRKQTPLLEAFHYRNVHSLHDVLSVSKKLAGARKKGLAEDENVVADAIEKFQKEILPLAELAGQLKKNIYKKETVVRPKSTNMDQVRGNCSCCKSDVAVDGGSRMAHHGYQRMDGFQSESCFGRDYPPLQTSDAGLVAWKDYVDRRIDTDVQKLEHADDLKSLMIPKRRNRSFESRGSLDKFETIYPGDEKWDKALRIHKEKLSSNIERLKSHSASLAKDIENWKTEWEGKPLRDVYGRDIPETAQKKTLTRTNEPGM